MSHYIAGAIQARKYLNMFKVIMDDGNLVSPRGSLIKEICDLQLNIDPAYPFMTFEDRKYPLKYFKREMRWKLGANKYDETIKRYATMWDRVQNPDRTFNSNYGQYWFGEQGGFWSVVTELVRDPDSRRAVIPMLNASHMTPETIDTVCTEAVGFRIRNHTLFMSVHMRSSDVIFGLGTDIPTFAFLYRLVFAFLADQKLVSGVGMITITAMSSHIYSRHFEMVEKIIAGDAEKYEPVTMPFCKNSQEAMRLIAYRGAPDVESELVGLNLFCICRLFPIPINTEESGDYGSNSTDPPCA